MLSKLANVEQKIIRRTTFGAALGWIAAWAWTIVAAGGGLWLFWTTGPWPLTNGWFALLSARFGLSGDWLVLEKIRGRHGLRSWSDCRCRSLFRRGENCFGSWK